MLFRRAAWLFVFLVLVLAGRGVQSQPVEWINVATISNTAGSLTNGRLCANDGRDIFCGATAPQLNALTGGLVIGGPISATTISGTIIQANQFIGDGSMLTGVGRVDRITSGTTSVVANNNGPVSVTIAGSNIANFGTGGLGITAINASGLITSNGISSTVISGTTGYFSGDQITLGTSSPISAFSFRRYMTIRGVTEAGVLELAKGSNDNDVGAVGVIQFSDTNVSPTGSEKSRVAAIIGRSNGSTVGDRGAKLEFYIKPDAGVLTLGATLTEKGSLAIGTAAPAASLTVIAGEIQTASSGAACSGTLAGAIRYNASNLYYCNGTAWTLIAGASGSSPGGVSGSIQFNSGGSFAGRSDMVVDSSGRVGIGAPAPAAALDVSGSMRATGVVSASAIKVATGGGNTCASSADFGKIDIDPTTMRIRLCRP